MVQHVARFHDGPSRAAARTHATSAEQRHRNAIVRASSFVVYASAFYVLVLCFINTHLFQAADNALMLTEVMIALLSVPILGLNLVPGFCIIVLCLCLNFVILTFFQNPIDPKALRDLLFPILFIWLGYVVGDRRKSETILRNIAIIAVVIGLVEFVFPTFYARIFDALAFFRSRGFGGTNKYSLFVLQVRPEGIGRSLLPFLGPRRISSFLLEPVSLGNFAVVIAAWAFSKPTTERRETIILLMLSVVLVVMADARFGSITILMLGVVRLSRIWRFRVFVGLMPLIAMAATVCVAYFIANDHQDNIVGRFQVSGNNLIDMPWSAWFGMPAAISGDAGYGYIIQRTGILICIFLWLLYTIVPFKDDQGKIFQATIAVYLCLSLCISGSSVFALKTTSLLWFLFGTVIAHASGPLFPLVTKPSSRTAGLTR